MEKPPARVNLLTKRFVSYLHSKNCNVIIVKQMISYGADVNYRDGNSNTPIHIVLQHCVDKLKLVADRWSQVMYSDDVEVLEELITHGAIVHHNDSDHNLPLHLAVQNNKKTFAEVLIRCGSHVNARNSKWETPLIIAVKNGNLDIVKVLLSSKASVSMDNLSMQSPVSVALACCVLNQHILIELMKYCPDMCMIGTNQMLRYAIARYYDTPSDNLLAVKTLLKCGVLHNALLMREWLKSPYLKFYPIFPQLKAFHEECILQKCKMKSELIHINFCLLDFVQEGFECKPMFQKKTPYRELIFNQILNISRNYPVYTDIIAYRLGKVDLCLKSMELCVYTLKESSKGKHRIFLTPDAVFQIAGFLSNEDVLNLITAFSDSKHFATHDFGFQSLAIGKPMKRKLNEKC